HPDGGSRLKRRPARSAGRRDPSRAAATRGQVRTAAARSERRPPPAAGGLLPPRVLLLLPTTTYRARDFIEAAVRLGVETVVGSEKKQALEDIAPGTSVTLDLRDPEAAAGQIVRLATTRPLAAVIPTDDDTAVVAAIASTRLRLPHNPQEAAVAARRKDLLRERLRAAGVRTPRYRVTTIVPDPEPGAYDQTYPCVLKPIFLCASRGFIRANDADEFVLA